MRHESVSHKEDGPQHEEAEQFGARERQAACDDAHLGLEVDQLEDADDYEEDAGRKGRNMV